MERSETNWIKQVPGKDVVTDLMQQTVLPDRQMEMGLVLSHVDKVLTDIPVYRMGCNISKEAALVAYEAMRPKE